MSGDAVRDLAADFFAPPLAYCPAAARNAVRRKHELCQAYAPRAEIVMHLGGAPHAAPALEIVRT